MKPWRGFAKVRDTRGAGANEHAHAHTPACTNVCTPASAHALTHSPARPCAPALALAGREDMRTLANREAGTCAERKMLEVADGHSLESAFNSEQRMVQIKLLEFFDLLLAEDVGPR